MANILILHTGGTICMATGPQGLVPAPGRFEAALSAMVPPDLPSTLVAFDPLVDSADIGSDHWNRMIDLILDNRDATGVIISHGTDTMTYTGAALSFALEGIGIPVVLTGSMKPLGDGLQAEANLRLAISTAVSGPTGVWLAFDGRLLCARRLVKHHSQGPDSFRQVHDTVVAERRSFKHRRFLPKKLSILTLSPGSCATSVEALLSRLDGAVLRVFGSGTLMQEPALLRVLREAVARGCRITAVSSCEGGGVRAGAYAADALLWNSGVESGGTLTAEAAYIKLWLELSEQEATAAPHHVAIAC